MLQNGSDGDWNDKDLQLTLVRSMSTDINTNNFFESGRTGSNLTFNASISSISRIGAGISGLNNDCFIRLLQQPQYAGVFNIPLNLLEDKSEVIKELRCYISKIVFNFGDFSKFVADTNLAFHLKEIVVLEIERPHEPVDLMVLDALCIQSNVTCDLYLSHKQQPFESYIQKLVQRVSNSCSILSFPLGVQKPASPPNVEMGYFDNHWCPIVGLVGEVNSIKAPCPLYASTTPLVCTVYVKNIYHNKMIIYLYIYIYIYIYICIYIYNLYACMISGCGVYSVYIVFSIGIEAAKYNM